MCSFLFRLSASSLAAALVVFGGSATVVLAATVVRFSASLLEGGGLDSETIVHTHWFPSLTFSYSRVTQYEEEGYLSSLKKGCRTACLALILSSGSYTSSCNNNSLQSCEPNGIIFASPVPGGVDYIAIFSDNELFWSDRFYDLHHK